MKSIFNKNGKIRNDFFKKLIGDVITDCEPTFELADVIVNHEGYDEEAKKPIGAVISVTYRLFSADLKGTLRVKVLHSVPIVTPEQLNAATDDIYVTIPPDTAISPYSMDKHGTDYTCVASSIKLL